MDRDRFFERLIALYVQYRSERFVSHNALLRHRRRGRQIGFECRKIDNRGPNVETSVRNTVIKSLSTMDNRTFGNSSF